MSRLAQRIAKLEHSRGNGYVASRFLHGNFETTAADYERLREQTLDEMVAAGEITEQQRDKVLHNRGFRVHLKGTLAQEGTAPVH